MKDMRLARRVLSRRGQIDPRCEAI